MKTANVGVFQWNDVIHMKSIGTVAIELGDCLYIGPFRDGVDLFLGSHPSFVDVRPIPASLHLLAGFAFQELKFVCVVALPASATGC